MRQIRVVPCCCCGHPVPLTPFLTCYGMVDLHEGLCRNCLGLVDGDRRQLLRDVRLELRICPEPFTLFLQIWRSAKAQASERHHRRRAA